MEQVQRRRNHTGCLRGITSKCITTRCGARDVRTGARTRAGTGASGRRSDHVRGDTAGLLQGRYRDPRTAPVRHHGPLAGGALRMAKDAEITERLDRIDEIIEQLNAAECDRDEGRDLYEEGQRLLAEIRERLDDGSGDIVDLE